MPKQLWKIEQFHGGLNSNADPRDINDAEFSDATDVMVDELGKIRTMGGTELPSDHANTGALVMPPGRGLIAFSHDPILAINGAIDQFYDSYPTDGDAWDLRYEVGNYYFGHEDLDYNPTNEGLGDGIQIKVEIKYNPVYVDADGNEYATQVMGTVGNEKLWMMENLKTTKYSDGADIPTGHSNEEWGLLDADYDPNEEEEQWDAAGAYAFYDDDIDNIPTYGNLYNWYAVNHGFIDIAPSDSHLAADGWHVATNGEWSDLIDSVQSDITDANPPMGVDAGSQLAGNADLWTNGDLEDNLYFSDSGFNAYPGGYRGFSTGTYQQKGTRANFWTSSRPVGAPYYHQIANDDSDIITGSPWNATNQGNGYSVRCVRDQLGDGSEITVILLNRGAGYESGDRLIIPGSLLSPSSDEPAEDITFYVDTVIEGEDTVPAADNLAVASGEPEGNGYINLYELTTDNNTWSVLLDMGYLDFDFEPVMYFVDGSLKICDGNFDNNIKSQVYETVYLGAPTGLFVNDKINFNQELDRPKTGTGEYKISLREDIPHDTGRINIFIKASVTEDSGNWDTEDSYYSLYATYSYRNNQESNTTVISSNAFGDGSDISQIVSIKISTLGNLVSKRIRAVNFYYSVNSDEDSSLYFLASADLEKGFNLHNGRRQEWHYAIDNGDTYIHAEVNIETPSVITFEARNGFSPNETIDARYKAVVVANRRTYIGNIFQNHQVYGDRMIKSPTNKFDTFPESNFIDASIQDGDDIIKLEEYADRLLQFKKNKMHLINISQNLEFLEDTFMHKGVSHPAATCKTDFGIAWVNKHGVYLYNGKDVSNLLEKKGVQIIKESEWTNFLSEDKDGVTETTPMIGYVPKKRQLIVFDDVKDRSDADPRMYLYDIVTQSWSTGAHNDSYKNIAVSKTNATTDWNADLIYMHTAGQVVRWDDTSKETSTFSFITRDIDFKSPGQKKRIYKVLITYKSDGASYVDVYSAKNRIETWTEITDAGGLIDTGGDWSTVELDITPDNIYSFRLKFESNGTTPADFEINDISILYRLKGAR